MQHAGPLASFSLKNRKYFLAYDPLVRETHQLDGLVLSAFEVEKIKYIVVHNTISQNQLIPN
jgi:hypothetical protein